MAEIQEITTYPEASPSFLVGRIKDGTKERIVPLKIKNNFDGTWSLDLSVTVDPGSITIGAVKLEDNDSNLRLDVVTDGALIDSPDRNGIYILGNDGTNNRLIELQQLNSRYHLLVYSAIKNVTGIQINPATEETVQAILNELKKDTINFIQYNEVGSVIGNLETSILSYTNSGTKLYLQSVLGSGESDAEYRFYINSLLKIQKRTSAAKKNAEIPFSTPYILIVGDIIDLKVFHYMSMSRKFNATFIGFRK